jgi:hypothetical protein
MLMGKRHPFAAIGKHHVDLFLVIIGAICIRSMHGVLTQALCECCPIRLGILDGTNIQLRDGIGNSIMDAFDQDHTAQVVISTDRHVLRLT